MLGVCLGHQSIGHAFGADIVRAKRLMHGKIDQIYHDGQGLFAGIESPMQATRYHSLVIRPGTLSDDFEVCAWADGPDGEKEIMGVRHKKLPLHGVQFHPESFLTTHGTDMLRTFLVVLSSVPRNAMLSVDEALQLVLQNGEAPCAADACRLPRRWGASWPKTWRATSIRRRTISRSSTAMRFGSTTSLTAKPTLRVVEEVTAGDVPKHAVEPGTTTRIMTGAPLPAGADAVVMVERSTHRRRPRDARREPKAKRGQNIVRRGTSMRSGDVVLRAGTARF